ncbi:hypothetical protein [Flavobacterium marginilacus]|uniref:hypothetical protein n=1 Tax=Flavobacterium marginilacus TaxID=3003256 RepID=UPI00248E31F4|nr:hypothetical protein [Flavobacterium marginilacus]
MPENEIIATSIHRTSQPVATKLDKNKKWAFSFQFFNQVKFFGLDTSDAKWFVSLLERLKDLSQKERSAIFSDKNTKSFYRYHKIDWASKNIPIKKSEINWISKEYIDNDDDFPFHQFQISKANGRVVGFWNEDHTIFYIVLLDPLHNIQPAQKYHYIVDDCYPLSCEYSSIKSDLHKVMEEKSKCDDCNIKNKISKIPTKLNSSTAVVGYLDPEFFNEYEKISHKVSFSQILQQGIYHYMGEE